jgi:hypothetical protein
VESQIYGPQKQICGWRARYKALRNRYVAGEPDIWPSVTDMWLESQIYGPQKQICGRRVRYRASETDTWLESQICGPQKQICGWRARYMTLKNRYVAGEPDIWPIETDMWQESQI